MTTIPFNNRYINLGEHFFVKTEPTPVANPDLIKFNEDLALTLGLSTEELKTAEGVAIFSGNMIPEGAEPLAMAYAGHQFGHYSPQLGDGRAILLGELDAPNGASYDMQLKGSGRTHYSRNGDGRAALGPIIREYLVSEAMAKLGVATTRALAMVSTGEEVARERLIPGGIITRIARSFIRVGSFQFFAATQGKQAVQKLSDYVIARNYPHLADTDNPYVSLLAAAVDGQASLIANWMHLGFIHGVMNTDNMSIAGETIDYGPCAFMDDYNPDQVYSSIDRNGRYAFSNQAPIGLWNLTRLAEALLPLFSENTDTAIDIAQEVLQTFENKYEKNWLTGMRAKIGLTANTNNNNNNDNNNNTNDNEQNDKELIEELLKAMAANHADYTLTFLHLSSLSTQSSDQDEQIRRLFSNPTEIDQWAVKWRKRLATETPNDAERQANMRSVNPTYIPRNHQVEAAIRAAEDHNDFSKFHELHQVLQQPYTQQPGKDDYRLPPKPEEIVAQTFCGT